MKRVTNNRLVYHFRTKRPICAQHCNVLEKIDDSEYGKFAWVIDPEGNKVELSQPSAGQ